MTASSPETPRPEGDRSPRRKWYLALGAVGAAVLLVGGIVVGASLTGGSPSATGASESSAARSSAATEASVASSDMAKVGLVLRLELSAATVTVYSADNLSARGAELAVTDYDGLSKLQPGEFTVDGVEISQDGAEAIIGLSDGASLSVSTTSLVTALATHASTGNPQTILGAVVIAE